MKTLFLILLFPFLTQGDLPNSLEKKVDKNIRRSFDLENIIRTEVELNSTFEDRPEIGLHLYTLEDQENLLGYLLVTTAKGRHDYFDYSVIYNTDLSIRNVSILVYRSDHGYEITQKKWLNQFKDKKGCELDYGEEIDAISGATYSASSITEDLKLLCNLLPDLVNQK